MKANIRKTIAVLILIMTTLIMVSCKPTPSPTPTPTPKATASPTESPDAMTTASIVKDAEAFEKAIGKDGTWIIALLNDISLNKDIVLDGEFKNNKGEVQRKIALYEQDADKKVTARYTLTAPKLTINSPNARIQSGTFKGDIYVNADKFQLVDATVEGNIYFASDELKNAFTMDATSKVTGKQEVKK